LANPKNIKPKYNHYIKKDWTEIYKERRQEFCDILDNEVTIGEAQLRIKFGYGRGIYEDTKRMVLQLYSDMYLWNPGTKMFSSIAIDAPLEHKEELK